MMKSTGVASDGIVHQALTKDNYERWKIVMQNYLQGQGLWDVVIKNVDANHTDQAASKKMKDGNALRVFQLSSWKHFTNQNNKDSRTISDLEQGMRGDVVQCVSEVETPSSWETKEKKALHILQLSCGREIVDEISHFKTAKEAWNYLMTSYGDELKASPDGEQAVLDDSLGQQNKELFRRVERGDYIGNIDTDSNIYIKSDSGRTLLHVAVIAGNLKNVEKLVKEGKDKLVNMQDNHGDTALALVARYTGNTNMAKCMVERKIGPRDEEAECMVMTTKRFRELVAENMVKTTTRFLRFLKLVPENMVKRTTRFLRFLEHVAKSTIPTTHEKLAKSSVKTKKGLPEDLGNSRTVKRIKRIRERVPAPNIRKSMVETEKKNNEQVEQEKCSMVETENLENKSIIETKKVEIREKLLEMQNKENVVPVLLAAANGYKELTTYLYSKTPSNVFDGTNSQNRVLLLSLCITAEIFDVALRLLRRFKDLPKESLSIYDFSVPKLLRESLSLPIKTLEPDSLHQSIPDKFSALVALAKMPSAFPSGTRFSRREQFIYDILRVEKDFGDNYGMPEIEKFVQKVTRDTPVVDDERPLKSSSVDVDRLCGIGTKVLDFLYLVMLYGWLFSALLVWIFLFWPLKHLGLLLRIVFREAAYLFVQSFKCLNIFGIRKIYEKKYTHYEVIGILSYFSQSIGEFNSSELKEASAYVGMLHGSQHGIIEYINAMRHANPDLLLAVDSCYRGIFSYAIMYRKQNVFQLMHGLEGRKEIFRRYRIDTFGNNILHLAAHLGPSSDRTSRSGAALQMQREIQWFKAVEKIVHPKFKEAKNSDGKKPYEIFTENHDELVKAGEKWAKETATSFTIVGTLITTIMFAAAFTVPGGNNQDTGLPIFLHDNAFTIFLIADAASLFTSATSVLIFIGILTSRYAEKDFLKSLPWKLFFALWFLFLSVCSMIVVFCAAIIMILKGYRTYKWFIVGPTMSLGSIPIIVLVVSQVRFMYEILLSTWKNPIRSIKK